MRQEEDAAILYVFDEEGNKRRSLDRQQLLQNSGKKHIIFANVLGDKFISIVEGRGKITVIKQDSEMKKKPVITKLPEIKEEDEAAEGESLWRREIVETLLMNLELFSKRFQGEILEIKIVCEPFEFMEIHALTDKNIWENATIKDMLYEEVTEDERDTYKECCYRNDIVWAEFCEECSEGRIKAVMESVCAMINKKRNIAVKLDLL